MTWDLSPSLAWINPVALNYFYRRASTGNHRDLFVTAGGPGLVLPGKLPDQLVHGFARRTSRAMRRVDHRVISVLDSSFDKPAMNQLLARPQILE